MGRSRPSPFDRVRPQPVMLIRDIQATISSTAAPDLKRSSGRELLWRAERDLGPEHVDQFLSDLRKKYPKSMKIDEEAALTLLQSCNHDRAAASRFADLPQWIKKAVKTVPTCRPKPSHVILNLDEDEHCLICKAGGTVLVCDVPGCSRLYHPACVGLGNVPAGTWRCPRHQCALCPENNIKLECDSCWISYCSRHAPFGLDSAHFKCINCATRYDDDRRMFLEELEMLRVKSASSEHGSKFKLLVHGKPVDLWSLYHSVAALGGFDNVQTGDWPRIYRHLGFRVALRGTSHSDLAEIYLTQLLPYADAQLNRKP